MNRRSFFLAPLASAAKDTPPEQRDSLAGAMLRLAAAMDRNTVAETGRYVIEGWDGYGKYPHEREVVFYPHRLEERVEQTKFNWRCVTVKVRDLFTGEVRTRERILEDGGWR